MFIGDVSEAEGVWQGFYVNPLEFRSANIEQPGVHEFAIEATFRMVAGRLEGEMVDLEPETTVPYTLIYQATLPQLNWAMRRMLGGFVRKHPDAMLHRVMPSDSSLEGTVEGSEVAFTKTYRGLTRYTILAGGREARETAHQSPPVRYRGQLSPDGQSISGEWEILRPGWLGRMKSMGRGSFELRRG